MVVLGLFDGPLVFYAMPALFAHAVHSGLAASVEFQFETDHRLVLVLV